MDKDGDRWIMDGKTDRWKKQQKDGWTDGEPRINN